MNIEYQTVGSTRAKIRRVPLLRLATNVVTDWMPGVPNSLARGFGDLLGNIIKPEPVLRMNRDGWVVQKTVAGFEKQWKQMTSWMLGVAFCRFVAEQEGYRWWAPVSAFTAAKRKTNVATGYWTKYLRLADCRVQTPTPAISNLYPDYVLARRRKSSSLPEISFAESKGDKRSIENRIVPPADWSSQSKNAEFIYNGAPMIAAQHLLVATRVNPGAEKPKTRKIQVRAWNSRVPENRSTETAFRAILAAHYIGVCERLDLTANAELIALNCLLDAFETNREELSHPRQSAAQIRDADFLRGRREELFGLAREEVQTRGTRANLIVYYNPNRAAFIVGDRTMQTGLSQFAMDAIGWLQGRNDADLPEDASQTLFESGAGDEDDDATAEEPDFDLRGDGVFSEWR